jgi:hypothetical protein
MERLCSRQWCVPGVQMAHQRAGPCSHRDLYNCYTGLTAAVIEEIHSKTDAPNSVLILPSYLLIWIIFFSSV